jgi:hypothetical protein
MDQGIIAKFLLDGPIHKYALMDIFGKALKPSHVIYGLLTSLSCSFMSDYQIEGQQNKRNSY